MEGSFDLKTRESEYDAHNGFCRVKGCVKKIHSFHHRLKNTKVNRRDFSTFISSPFNCAGLCDLHHVNHSSVSGLDINSKEAMIYEEYLQALAKSSAENRTQRT